MRKLRLREITNLVKPIKLISAGTWLYPSENQYTFHHGVLPVHGQGPGLSQLGIFMPVMILHILNI